MRGVALSIVTSAVTGVIAVIVALSSGCAPDYAHTAFRCDAEHDCPAGQACIMGRCRHGEPTGDGVACGMVTCDLTQQCCIDMSNPARCIAAGDVCPGTSALCDGVEDCQAGDQCCASGSTVSCDPSCEQAVCRDAADCPSTAPNCCPQETPWGECQKLACGAGDASRLRN